jgi:hypothetical protein
VVASTETVDTPVVSCSVSLTFVESRSRRVSSASASCSSCSSVVSPPDPASEGAADRAAWPCPVISSVSRGLTVRGRLSVSLTMRKRPAVQPRSSSSASSPSARVPVACTRAPSHRYSAPWTDPCCTRSSVVDCSCESACRSVGSVRSIKSPSTMAYLTCAGHAPATAASTVAASNGLVRYSFAPAICPFTLSNSASLPDSISTGRCDVRESPLIRLQVS